MIFYLPVYLEIYIVWPTKVNHVYEVKFIPCDTYAPKLYMYFIHIIDGHVRLSYGKFNLFIWDANTSKLIHVCIAKYSMVITVSSKGLLYSYTFNRPYVCTFGPTRENLFIDNYAHELGGSPYEFSWYPIFADGYIPPLVVKFVLGIRWRLRIDDAEPSSNS